MSNKLRFNLFLSIEAINRDTNSDTQRPITININNSIHLHLPQDNDENRSPDDESDMNIQDEIDHNSDDSDGDNGSRSQTSSHSDDSSGSSQVSATYATPVSNGPIVQPKASSTG